MKILEKLRDPIWQFQGVVGTVLGIIIAIAIALEAPLWVPVSLGALTVVIVALPLLPFPAIKERVRKLVSITKRFCKSLAPKLLLLLLCFVALEIAILYAYADWKIVVLSLAFLLLVILLVRLLTRYYLASKQKNLVEGQPTFSPVPLSGIGTHYFQALYVDPPFGNVKLGEVEFQLQSKSVAFTTNDIRSYIHRNNGTIEVDLHLQIPIRFVKSVHILINSSNSKSIYAYREIGAIELVFTGLPKLTTKLVLGKNIRESCIGAPGDLVRTTSDPSSKPVWKGVNKNGTYAVIDSLHIPVPEPIRRSDLVRINLIHNPMSHEDDELGVHYFVFAITAVVDTQSKTT